jgi:hypothetical protein
MYETTFMIPIQILNIRYNEITEIGTITIMPVLCSEDQGRIFPT